jgi:hypothetical protein
MALNLARNSRVFFTTNVNSAGTIQTTGFSPANTYELQVLDGFTFSQNTTQDTVTLSEAGVNPVRGQRSFNTALSPADFSMSTYIRPFKAASSITAEESVLWNALLGAPALYAELTSTGTNTVVSVTSVTAGQITFGTAATLAAGTAITFPPTYPTLAASGGGFQPNTTYYVTTATTNSATAILSATLGGTAFTTTTATVSGTPTVIVSTVKNNIVSVPNTAATPTYAGASGEITIATSATTTNLSVGDTIVIGGLTASTDSDTKIINAAAKVITNGTSSLVLSLISPKAPLAAGTAITISALGANSVKLYKSAWAPVKSDISYASVGASDLNQLQTFGMLFAVDNVLYTLDNCAMTQVSIDFGLDGIATAAWSGQGTKLNESAISIATLAAAATAKNVAAPFITNKLSTVDLELEKALGSVAAGRKYTLALTGGNITINNNINYITPANLATVNVANTYYTGTRAISGTLNAYLKTGNAASSENTGELLRDMLAAITSSTLSSTAIEPMFNLVLSIGGKSATAPARVELEMQSVVLSVPTVDVQQVISTAINFTAQGYKPGATAADNTFAVDVPNDLAIRYFAT